jgi:putative hydrolase of HD superfamily
MNEDKILNFIYELGHLRRVSREGWRLLGIDAPESVAEHSLRTAQIAWILATMERIENPHEAVTIALFHDIGETRIGDQHKVAARYGELDEARAVQEQCAPLAEMGSKVLEMWEQIESRSTPSGIIAKDADLVELAITAKEYIEMGHQEAQDWIDSALARVKTDSAKKLMAAIPTSNSKTWWKGLKSIT